MKNIISLAMLLLAAWLPAWSQIGEGYNPSNPGDPATPVTGHTLTLSASPTEGGSFNFTSQKVTDGETCYINAYPSYDFKFVCWMEGGDTISRSPSYNFKMPSRNVALTGVFAYSPQSPDDPGSPVLTYPLTVKAEPANSGSFNFTYDRVAAGFNNDIVAYPSTDYSFRCWTIGDSVVSTAQRLPFVMPAHEVTLTGHFYYNPQSPAGPNENYFNPETGEMIIDSFTPGNLWQAIYNSLGSHSYDDVVSITVAGRMESYDFGFTNSFNNCAVIDLSRVAGISELPSYAFSYSNVESIILPASIEKIGYHAFYDCPNLTSITLYSSTPPAVDKPIAANVPPAIILYVPVHTLPLYQEDPAWENFVLLPLQGDIRSLTVNLPSGTDGATFDKMWLELTNAKNGQRVHFVMTDKTAYTFPNLLPNTVWDVALRNEAGDIFAQLKGIEVGEEDVAVTLSGVLMPQNLTLIVTTPGGEIVTDRVQITWQGTDGSYLAQGPSLPLQPTGKEVTWRLTLPQELAMEYLTPSPVTVKAGDNGNRALCTLQPIPSVTVTGKVTDASTTLPLRNASVAASQTFGGKYTTTASASTDQNGEYSMTLRDVPTTLAFSASDYVSQTLTRDSLTISPALPAIALKQISGAVIDLAFTYREAAADGKGETTDWYNDYRQVTFSVTDKTTGKEITGISYQYPQLVVIDDTNPGDMLTLTASSLSGAFSPVSVDITLDSDLHAAATINIVEPGRINATFQTTDNAEVAGMLYGNDGKLLKNGSFSNATLELTNLPDGDYTLVTMGRSTLFNSILDLSQLPATGLATGSDYIVSPATVTAGTIAEVNIDRVPTLDESKLYYTGPNTSFTVNKNSIVIGNYLTLTGRIDFKAAYADKVRDLQLVVDLPKDCSFVENSVMVGNSTSPYSINGSRLTIPVGNYADRVRFCVIPTAGGNHSPSAFVSFTLDGKETLQPIGSATYTAEALSLSVPSTVAKTKVPVSGTAIGTSTIEIFDNDNLVGTTKSLANGSWATTIDLNDPYDGTTHSIHATASGKNGLKLRSETVDCWYDTNAIRPVTANMTFYNGWLHRNVSVDFNFDTQTTSEASFMFYTTTDFTFTVDFTRNDTTLVSDVSFTLLCSDNSMVTLPASFDDKIEKWVAKGRFSFDNVPVNLSVEYFDNSVSKFDMRKIEDYVLPLAENYDDYTKQRAALEEATARIEQMLDSPSPDYDAIETLLSELNEAHNLNLDLSLENEQVDSILKSWETLSDAEITAMENILMTEIAASQEESQAILDWAQSIYTYSTSFEVTESAFGSILKSGTCDGLTSETLLADGYMEIPTSTGGALYVKLSNDTISMADFANNILQTVIIPEDDDTYEMAMLMAMNLPEGINFDNLVEIFRPMLKSLKEKGKEIKSLLSRFSKFTASNIESSIGEFISLAQKTSSAIEAYGYKVVEVANKIQTYVVEPIHALIKLQDELTKQMWRAKGVLKHCKDFDKKVYWLGQVRNLETRIGKISSFVGAPWIKSSIAAMSKYAPVLGIAYSCSQYAILTGKIIGTASTIFPCDGDKVKACLLAIDCVLLAKQVSEYTFNMIAVDVASALGVLTTAETGIGPVALALLKMGVAFVSDVSFNTYYDIHLGLIQKAIGKLQCLKKPDPNDPNNPKNPKNPNNPKNRNPFFPFRPLQPIHDPSGYVYEGVSSNRLEGVTATVFYKEEVADMYGDIHEEVVMWDAAEFAQENPLFTDENGMYRWDVPQGLWQVKFEKEGYETTFSEWLPVPPPQLEVNIPMKQNRQPVVKLARAYEDAVEVEFDKYMTPETLTADNIRVMVGNRTVDGSVVLLNEEEAYENTGTTFASKVRFNADKPFGADDVTIFVSNRVKSYAGIRMQDDFSQSFGVQKEITSIEVEPFTTVAYGGAKSLTVAVLPLSASAGKTLRAYTSSDRIVTLSDESLTLDSEGRAEITIYGELPGTAALTFAVEGTDLTAVTTVNVDQPSGDSVEAPTASIASGAYVEKGTELYLSCATDNAQIYYTTDGSCPCETSGSRQLYDGSPIVITETVTIKAIAVGGDGSESEVAEFNYLVDSSHVTDLTDDTLEIYPLPVRDRLNVSAGGTPISYVSLTSVSGQTVALENSVNTLVTIDVTAIPKGVYIINIVAGNRTYSRKIVKVN